MSAKNVEIVAESGTERFIPLNKLKKSPNNARKTPHSEASIEAYAASIAAKGILQNLVVEPELDTDGAATGFEVLPRRWVVERTFAWLGRCRRLAKDFEATIASAVAWAFVAHIRTLTRRLARA